MRCGATGRRTGPTLARKRSDEIGRNSDARAHDDKMISSEDFFPGTSTRGFGGKSVAYLHHHETGRGRPAMLRAGERQAASARWASRTERTERTV